MGNFYKIECKETLKLIDDFFDKRDELYERVVKLCKHFGFEHHQTTDHIVFGISFLNMTADPRKDTIDKDLWKTSKIKNSHFVAVRPRTTAKENKAKYDSMLPKPMTYDVLNELILAKGVDVFFKTYGYRYKKGEYFMFETSLPVSSIAIEIVGSEYSKDAKNEN